MNPFKYLIMIPFGWILLQLYKVVDNYGIALILFAVLIKLLLLPVSIKSKKSMMKISRISPRMKELQAKYGDDQQKYQLEVSKLYKEEGVSMGGGCLWSLIPMLILIPLYYVIRQPLTYVMGLAETEIAQIVEILVSHGIEIDTSNYYYQTVVAGYIGEFFTEIKAAVPDAVNMNFSLLGLNLGATPTFKIWNGEMTWANIGLWLLPWISGGLNMLQSWLSQKMNNTVATNDKGEIDEDAARMTAQSNKSMMIMMPLMSVYIGFVVPGGLSLYWIIQALFSMVQDTILTQHFRKVYDEEDAIKAAHAAELAAIEEEKERRREERRAQLGDVRDPNTSKKKAKALDEARLKAEKEAYLASKAPKKEAEEAISPAGDPERPYSNGRSYKADRYPDPKTTYQPVTLDETPDEPAQADETTSD